MREFRIDKPKEPSKTYFIETLFWEGYTEGEITLPDLLERAQKIDPKVSYKDISIGFDIDYGDANYVQAFIRKETENKKYDFQMFDYKKRMLMYERQMSLRKSWEDKNKELIEKLSKAENEMKTLKSESIRMDQELRDSWMEELRK